MRWRVTTPAQELRVAQGAQFRVGIAATIDTGWKLYSLTPQKGGPIATTIELGDSAFVLDSIAAPEPTEFADRNFNLFTFIYTSDVRFDVRARARANARPGRYTLPVLVSFQTCTDRYCLPPRTDSLSVVVRVVAGNALASPTAGMNASIPAAVNAPVSDAVNASVNAVSMVAPTDLASFARFIWLAFTMGLLSLMTPCVLPMIPITMAYFGGADAANRQHRARAALAHAGGIVVAFTLLGILVATLLGAGGVIQLAANPVLNLAIAALFIAFALNLAGAFEITLPQRLLTLASSAGAGNRHTTGALLMGAAFAVTSFTCTVPFVGTLLVLATQGSWRWPLVGLATYGAAFALPFFALALAPAALDKLPRSGPWMITLKRSVAIAEVALAIKFLSNVDLVIGTNLLSREVVIALWLVGAIAIAALWIIAAIKIRSNARPNAVVMNARMNAAMHAVVIVVMTTVALQLGLGLRGRSLGELEAYLPPRPELSWIMNDYEGALSRGRAENRAVLLDFTGYTCTNCRWMEANMFQRPEIASQMERFVRVRLYTDGRGEPYVAQQRLQLDRFGTVALPYYAVVRGDGAPIATFLGMTRDPKEFAQFLSHGLPATDQ